MNHNANLFSLEIESWIDEKIVSEIIIISSKKAWPDLARFFIKLFVILDQKNKILAQSRDIKGRIMYR